MSGPVETDGLPVVIAGDTAVFFTELDEPRTEGQTAGPRDPEEVSLSQEHDLWRTQAEHHV